MLEDCLSRADQVIIDPIFQSSTENMSTHNSSKASTRAAAPDAENSAQSWERPVSGTQSLGPNDDASQTDPPSAGTSFPPEATSSSNTIEAQLKALEDERDKLRNQVLRTAADFDNYRKRSRRDQDDAVRRAKEDILKEMLPVFDNLGRAIDAATSAQDIKAIVQGVEMVLRMFDDVGQRVGLERIAAVGQPFDPSVHDALQQLETIDHPPGIVVSELVPGYRFGDRLLRPAMVVVARAPAKTIAPGANLDDETSDPSRQNLS